MTRIFNRLTRWGPETWQGIYALVWGFWLVLPFTTFGAYPTWDFLASIMPELAWGLVTMLAGTASIVLAQRGTPRARIAANAILAPGWIFMAWVSIASAPPATIGVVLGVLGLHQIVLLVDAIYDAGRGTPP